MATIPSPPPSQLQAGFNHNVTYAGQTFHVQTEDSGLRAPHITTVLFAGGNIITSIRQSYADKITVPNVGPLVVKLMQQQHKAMLRNLKAGRFDALIAARPPQIEAKS